MYLITDKMTLTSHAPPPPRVAMIIWSAALLPPAAAKNGRMENSGQQVVPASVDKQRAAKDGGRRKV